MQTKQKGIYNKNVNVQQSNSFLTKTQARTNVSLDDVMISVQTTSPWKDY